MKPVYNYNTERNRELLSKCSDGEIMKIHALLRLYNHMNKYEYKPTISGEKRHLLINEIFDLCKNLPGDIQPLEIENPKMGISLVGTIERLK